MKQVLTVLAAVCALSLASTSAARASWLVESATVASMAGGHIVVTTHAGSGMDNFSVNENTVVQVEIPGTLQDIKIGQPVRLVSLQGRIAAGETAITVKRVRILYDRLEKSDNPNAGYHGDYVQGYVTTLSPYLQIATPGGVTVTAALTQNVQVITYRFGGFSDIGAGSIIDAELFKDRTTRSPTAAKIWVWDVTPN